MNNSYKNIILTNFVCSFDKISDRFKVTFFYAESATTLLRIFPIDSISLSIKSPGAKNSAGLRCIPTPDGVPVKMTSPGFKVIVLNECNKKSLN